MTTFTTTQPSLAGRTLYAVLSRSGVTLATVAMAEAPAGTFAASVPAGIAPGELLVVAYRRLGAGPDPATDWPVASDVVDHPGDPGDHADLVAAILADLPADPALQLAGGLSPADPRVFEARDLRRAPEAPYPYAVLVDVAGRYRDLTGRGDAAAHRYFDLHWLDDDPARAYRLRTLSVARLRASASAGRLDSDEGPVGALVPSTLRAVVDPRNAAGSGPSGNVMDAMVQLQFVLKATV